MTLDLTCQQCDASFELDLAELMEDDKIQCPSCDATAPRDAVKGLTSALDELYGQLARLHKRFAASFALDSDELPSPFDRDRGAAPDEEDAESDEAWEESEDETDDEAEDEPEDLDL